MNAATIVSSDMLLIGVLLVGMLLGGGIVYLGGRFMCVLLLATLTGCAAPPYVCLPRMIDDDRGFLCVPLERRAPEAEPAALSHPHLYGRPSTVFYELKCES